jgi:hypothetical protein
MASAATAAASAPSGPAKSSGWRSVALRSPAGGSYGNLAAIVCTAKASCTAGGSYEATATHSGAPMIAIESSGRWARGVRIRLPADAPASDGSATIAGISCPSRSACVATGNYTLPTNALHGLITTGHASTWSRARTPDLPAGSMAAGDSFLTGVSCTRPGSCVAVGGYTTLAGSAEAMAETESVGHWKRAVIIRSPANAGSNPQAHLAAVSCPKAGDCVAVGGYTTTSGGTDVMAVAEVRGTWGRAREIRMPANSPAEPFAELYSVSCPSDGRCMAVGSYSTTADRGLPLTVAESGGHWRRAIGLTGLPADAANANQQATLNAVTCKGRSCVAVGAYVNAAGGSLAMAITELRGRWSRAVGLAVPPHAARGIAQDATLFGVACNGPANCAAVGQFVNSAHVNQAMAATRS